MGVHVITGWTVREIAQKIADALVADGWDSADVLLDGQWVFVKAFAPYVKSYVGFKIHAIDSGKVTVYMAHSDGSSHSTIGSYMYCNNGVFLADYPYQTLYLDSYNSANTYRFLWTYYADFNGNTIGMVYRYSDTWKGYKDGSVIGLSVGGSIFKAAYDKTLVGDVFVSYGGSYLGVLPALKSCPIDTISAGTVIYEIEGVKYMRIKGVMLRVG